VSGTLFFRANGGSTGYYRGLPAGTSLRRLLRG
jgi:hypothetical protein